jgi:hypothetical protein
MNQQVVTRTNPLFCLAYWIYERGCCNFKYSYYLNENNVTYLGVRVTYRRILTRLDSTVPCVFAAAVACLLSRCVGTTGGYTYRHTDWWETIMKFQPGINTPCVCIYYAFRPIAAIIRYTELFIPSIWYTSLHWPMLYRYVVYAMPLCYEGWLYPVMVATGRYM